MLDLIIKNHKIRSGKLQKKDIGMLKKVKLDRRVKNSRLYGFDRNKLIVLPGCVTQVHFREPGITDFEDLNSGGKPAIVR